MTKEKQILLLYAEGNSQHRIADTLWVSRNTFAADIAAAKRACLSGREITEMEDVKLLYALFPEKSAEPVKVKPDFERIHKELLRHGVTLRLLWDEYINTCRETHNENHIRRECRKISAAPGGCILMFGTYFRKNSSRCFCEESRLQWIHGKNPH